MVTYIFATRSKMDLTRKSLTGPGCTLTTGPSLVHSFTADSALPEQRLKTQLAMLCVAAGLEIGKRPAFAMDDQGRCIVFYRKMAVAALVPKDQWAGFLFVPKAG